jgi:hypothetical protein
MNVVLVALCKVLTQIRLVDVPLELLALLLQEKCLNHRSSVLLADLVLLDCPLADSLTLFLPDFVEQLPHYEFLPCNLALDGFGAFF